MSLCLKLLLDFYVAYILSLNLGFESNARKIRFRILLRNGKEKYKFF